MIQESFEIEVKKNKKIDNNLVNEDEDEGSDITDDEPDYAEEFDDEQQTEILNYLIDAFSTVADVEAIGANEFDVTFHNPNVMLLEDNANYEFDIINDVPYLDDPSLFIPFVNFMKNHEPSLTGVALYTNLEGGGSLVI